MIKANNKAMDEVEIRKFMDNPIIGSLFVSGTNIGVKIRAVCSTAIALGYDESWVGSILKHELEARFLS